MPAIPVPPAALIQSPNLTPGASAEDEILRIIYATALKPPKHPKEPEPTSDELMKIPPLDILDLPDILTKRLRRGDPYPPILYYGYPSPPNYLDLMYQLGHPVRQDFTFIKEDLRIVYVKTNREWVVDKVALPGFIELFGHGERPKWYLSNQYPCWKWPIFVQRYRDKDDSKKDTEESEASKSWSKQVAKK